LDWLLSLWWNVKGENNMRTISFPSIEQFRNAVKEVVLRATYVGKAEDGTPLYDDNLPTPTVTFKGTVKIHGTNAGVCYNPVSGLWYQSRESLITPTQDNAGFARWAEANKASLETLFVALAEANCIAFGPNTVVAIYGEWAGQGIHQGVGINQLPKAFYIIGVKVSHDADDEGTWLDTSGLRSNENRIFNVEDYATYEVAIDFNNPQTVQATLAELTAQVEAECPIAKAHGVSGVGEGIVWRAEYTGKRILFKVKGEKHSVSKVRDVAGIEPEKLASVEEFTEYAVTENRFHQALTVVFGDPMQADVKKLGEVIKWMNQDVLKEETDTLEASGLTWKEVNGRMAARTREMFFALEV
jgi:RNA ligase